MNDTLKARLRTFLSTWTDELTLRSRQVPMSDEESNLFVTMCLNEAFEQPIHETVTSSFPYKLLQKRCDHFGMTYSPQGLAFLTTLCDTPGALVMFAAALRQRGQPATTEGIAQVFPSGFPTEEYMHAMWDKQKGHAAGFDADNVLDLLSAAVWQ